MSQINFKLIISLLIAIFLTNIVFSADIFNANGDFSVKIESQNKNVFNDNIKTKYFFTITNNNRLTQDFSILINEQEGFDINLEPKTFSLNKGENKSIELEINANSEFDYSPNVVSPNSIVLVQKDNYVGQFTFPVTISGKEEQVSAAFKLLVDKKEFEDVEYEAKFASNNPTPINPLGYSIQANNIIDEQKVEIKVELGDLVIADFTDTFSKNQNYKVYQAKVGSKIFPGEYRAKITIRAMNENAKSINEWFQIGNVNVIPYKQIIETTESKSNIFKDSFTIRLVNNGNVADTYNKEIEVGFFKSLLFGSSNDNYESSENGIRYEIVLQSGEEKEFTYSYNFLALYIVILVILIIVTHIYIRKTSNPLDVETEIYNIKKETHEGVKSMKVKVGFENIKENELETLKIIFRMPSYLQVKDNSFLLTEPNHVLKGRNQYKLVWDFKRFEKNDSRIVGLELVNKKGILGDIKLPDLEIEVKVNGKIRKYYHGFQIIKG